MGNPTPVLQISGSVLSTKPIGIDRDHLRCIIQDHEGEVMEAVGFGMYQTADCLMDTAKMLILLCIHSQVIGIRVRLN